MTCVIDTSVWISAMLSAKSHGKPMEAVKKCIGAGKVAICDEIEHEILDILNRKFRWDREKAAELFETVLPFPLRISIVGDLHACRDPNDDMILECAVIAGASIIVTGEKDLLVLDPFRGIRVLTPGEYLALDS